MTFGESTRYIISLSADDGNHDQSRTETVKKEAMATCVLKKWAGLMQVMALSSVLKQVIYSVYPNYSLGIRPLFHGPIQPRDSNFHHTEIFYIMWSRCDNFDNRIALFQPNHFVPLLKLGYNIRSEHDFPILVSSDIAPSEWKSKPSSLKRKKPRRKRQAPMTAYFPKPHSQEAKLDVTLSECQIQTANFKHKRLDHTQINRTQPNKDDKVCVHLGKDIDVVVNGAVQKNIEVKNADVFQSLKDSSSQRNQSNQIPFPFLSHKWYQDQALDESKLKASAHIEGDKSDILPFSILSRDGYGKNVQFNSKLNSSMITDNSEILPYSILSRDWYGKQTKSTANRCHADIETLKIYNVIPLKKLSKSWYKRQGQLAQKNVSRGKIEIATGTLEENIKKLQEDVLQANASHADIEMKTVMIEVARYLLNHGPIVRTQEVGQFISDTEQDLIKNKKKSKRRPMSFDIFKKIQRHLNVVQIYVKGTAYILENRNYDLSEVTERLSDICKSSFREEINKHVRVNTSDLLQTAIRFADTKRDADLIKALFAKTTSVKHVAKMLKRQNRSSIRTAEQQLCHKLHEFKNLEFTSQVVRNDLTNEQQRRLTKRIIAQRKRKIFKLQFETRGRALKADLFPELKFVLEEIFSYGSSGLLGGLESHPRLTTDVLYRSRDNNLFMRQAREILLKVAPPGFAISLASCYNYTESYKENTYSAKRHHAGKDVNARIALKCPPRTGVFKQVINLHWSTKNVNLLVENCMTCNADSLIDSKDAKTVICGDIQPVQNPGKSWKPIIYPDHTFDQSRTNAVYPMAHLFLGKNENICENDPKTIEITRTGRPALIINIAFFEHETTFRAMNEFLYLLTQPSLDVIFRNAETGKLKSIFGFLVDNGHGEDPDSPLTQMCLARILHLLKLKKISQRSFAEYNSKRNFVERVHAAENTALSRHGAFDSRQIHANPHPGTKEHLENMERMAEDVKNCLSQARFAGKFLECYRGIGGNGIFSDEERLKEFLTFSEEKKEECTWVYSPSTSENPHFQALVQVWGVPEDFEGSYIKDYNVIMNKKGKHTAWNDKYSTNLYGNNNDVNLELQPIPDYVSWLTSGGELHYLSIEKTSSLYAVSPQLVDVPGLFLPSRILDTFFIIDSDPPDDILHALALLTWITVDDVIKYFKNKRERMESDYQQNIERENWRNHKLYKKSLAELHQICKKNDLPLKGNKHEIVRRIAEKNGETDENSFYPDYNGQPSSLPNTIANIRRLPIATLKYILKSHALSYCGNKDDLVLRVFLLSHGRSYLCSFNQATKIKEMIATAKKIIAEEVKEYLLNTDDVKRIRVNRSILKEKSKIRVPENVMNVSDLHQLFKSLERYLARSNICKNIDTEDTVKSDKQSQSDETDSGFEDFFEVGTHVKVRWTKEEIGDSGWRPGWYVAQVQKASSMLDQIEVVYISEPESVYKIDVTSTLAKGKLQLSR